jgi:hypothetical protein
MRISYLFLPMSISLKPFSFLVLDRCEAFLLLTMFMRETKCFAPIQTNLDGLTNLHLTLVFFLRSIYFY